jgi:hypothetical protein
LNYTIGNSRGRWIAGTTTEIACRRFDDMKPQKIDFKEHTDEKTIFGWQSASQCSFWFGSCSGCGAFDDGPGELG